MAEDTVLKLRDAENKLVTLSEKLTLAEAKAMQAETKIAGLSLELKDREATISTQSSELKTLRDNEKLRADADEKAAVDTAFATYKDVKKLSDLDKEQMLLTYRGNRELFSRLYPTVAPDQRHLMRTIAPPGVRPSHQQGEADARTIAGAGKNPDEMIQLKDKYVKEGMSPEAALNKAYNESVTQQRQGARPHR